MHIKRFPLGMLWTNCYLIWDDEDNGFAVDPGGPAQEVIDFINMHHIKLDMVLLTHGHNDHIAGVEELRGIAAHGVAIHEDDAGCLDDPSRNLSTLMGEPVSVHKAARLLPAGDPLRVAQTPPAATPTPGPHPDAHSPPRRHVR